MRWRIARIRTGAKRGAKTGAVIVATSVFAASCGGGGGPSTGSSPPPSPSADSASLPPAGAIPTAPADAALAATVPARYKASGLTIAMAASYPPDEFVGPDGHTLVGMDADLGYAIGQVLHLKVRLVNTALDTIISGLLDGKYDVGDSSFSPTPARATQVDFVTYFEAGEGFFVAGNSTQSFNGLGSLCGHSVAVQSGTTELTFARQQAKKCKITIAAFATQQQVDLAVSTGRDQVGFADSQVASYIAQRSNGALETTGQPIEVAPYGIALPKNSGLDAPFLGAIKQLMSDGVYATILARWAASAGAITSPTIIR